MNKLEAGTKVWYHWKGKTRRRYAEVISADWFGYRIWVYELTQGGWYEEDAYPSNDEIEIPTEEEIAVWPELLIYTCSPR